jgi:uncharacterized membrane protein YedE/YeeE
MPNRWGLVGFAVALLAVAAWLTAEGSIQGLEIFAVSLLLGGAFVWLDFGFTAGFRDLLVRGDGRALAAAAIIPAILALVVLPVGAGSGGYGRFLAPVGLSLLLGAAVFGVGMQLANGCGSGCLVAAGQGSRRMLVALPCFALGGVVGTLLLPTALGWPNLGVLDLATLGPWVGLAATEALLGLLALVLLRGARPDPARLTAGAVIGLLAVALFLVAGEPWGITMGLTLLGAKAVRALGVDLATASFWASDGARALLDAPALAMPSALSDVGLLLGAGIAACAAGRFRLGASLTRRQAAAGALGGALMGVGARLSFGCNIGAFISGTASGSLHGLVWIVAVLPGCWLGIRLRPWFERVPR